MRRAPVRGVLFDKDGTLLDFHATWMPAYREAVAEICAEAGRPDAAPALLVLGGYDPASGRCAPGSPLACGTTPEIAAIWARALDAGDPAAVLRRVAGVFERRVLAGAAPVTDLPALFTRLAGRGLVLGLATMDSEASARAVLERFGAARWLRFTCGADSGHGEKPGPGMVQAFCRACRLDPAEVMVVGDTPHDLHMGRSAGAGRVVAVLTGASLADPLAALADDVLPSVDHLEALLDGLEAGGG